MNEGILNINNTGEDSVSMPLICWVFLGSTYLEHAGGYGVAEGLRRVMAVA